MRRQAIRGIVLGLVVGTLIACGVAIVTAIALAVLQLYIAGHNLETAIPLGKELVHVPKYSVHLSGYDCILLGIVLISWIGSTGCLMKYWTRPARQRSS